MGETLEQYVQQALQTNNWNNAVTRMENAVLQRIKLEPKLLEQLPADLLEGSALLQIARCEELIHLGQLHAAREGLSKAIKKVAAQGLRQPLLSALSMLAVVNVRMGLIHEAKPIVRFLRDEWDEADEEIGGETAHALARGLYLLEVESGDEDKYYRCAIHAFDRDGESERGSIALFEMIVRGYARLSSSEWEERITEFTQRVRRGQADEELLRYLHALRLLTDGRLEQAELAIKDCRELSLPYPDQNRAILLQVRLALRASKLVQASQLLADLDTQQLEMTADLEWQFEWAELQLELAVSRSDWNAARMLSSQLRAILLMGLPHQFGERLAQIDHTFLEEQLTEQKHAEAHRDQSSSAYGGQWRASLFGMFRFSLGDRILQSIAWKRKKTKELALYLLLQQGYFAAKEQIAEALYPDHDSDKMANQLYVAAHQLKSVIHEYFGVDGGVIIKDGIVRLKDGLISEVDVEQYYALVRVGDQLWLQDRDLADQMYEKAALLYDDIALDVQYVDWLEQFRSQLMKQQGELLHKLGRYAVDKAVYDRAELFYRQWISISPLNEEAYQELLRVLCIQGKLSEAEFLFDQLEKQLQKELGINPLNETRRIIWR